MAGSPFVNVEGKKDEYVVKKLQVLTTIRNDEGRLTNRPLNRARKWRKIVWLEESGFSFIRRDDDNFHLVADIPTKVLNSLKEEKI